MQDQWRCCPKSQRAALPSPMPVEEVLAEEVEDRPSRRWEEPAREQTVRRSREQKLEELEAEQPEAVRPS